MRGGRVAALAALAILLSGCGQDDKPAPTSSAPSAAPTPATGAGQPAPSAGGDPATGRQVWLAQCVACHNTDPAKDGPVGPAVKGSSLALLESRVLTAGYPPGYRPKRDSKVMPPRPDLAASIPDLAAYLR